MGLAFRSGCGRQVVEGGGRRCHGGSWRLPPGERGHCSQVCKRDRLATAKNRSRLHVPLNGQADESVRRPCIATRKTTREQSHPVARQGSRDAVSAPGGEEREDGGAR